MGPVFHIDDDVLILDTGAKAKIYRFSDEARTNFEVMITHASPRGMFKKGQIWHVHRNDITKVPKEEFAWE
jgi:hypothetical protein